MGVTETYGNTWKQTGLSDTQEDAGDEKAVIVAYDAHQSHDCAPGNHNCGKPDTGAELLEEQIRGHLERCVGEEEDGQTPVVLVG